MSGTKVKIKVDDITIDAELNDSDTAAKILEILPIEGRANVWGDEIYFDIPLHIELETDARAGGKSVIWDIGPPGRRFVFFMVLHR